MMQWAHSHKVLACCGFLGSKEQRSWQKSALHRIQKTSQFSTCMICPYSGNRWGRGPRCTWALDERLRQICVRLVQIHHRAAQWQIHRDEGLNQRSETWSTWEEICDEAHETLMEGGMKWNWEIRDNRSWIVTSDKSGTSVSLSMMSSLLYAAHNNIYIIIHANQWRQHRQAVQGWRTADTFKHHLLYAQQKNILTFPHFAL